MGTSEGDTCLLEVDQEEEIVGTHEVPNSAVAVHTRKISTVAVVLGFVSFFLVVAVHVLRPNGSKRIETYPSNVGTNFSDQIIQKVGSQSSTWTCHPKAWAQWQEYCDSDESPKSWAMTHDCSHYWQVTGRGIGVTNLAINKCEELNHGKKCYTYDNNGRECFNNCHPGKQSHSTSNWVDYCKQRTSKAWYTTKDCNAYGNAWGGHNPVDRATRHCEHYAHGEECIVFDDGGATRGPHCIPACTQRFSQWCWATVAASIASYWDPDNYPAVGPDSCRGDMCKIASAIKGHTCCKADGNFHWNHDCNEAHSLHSVTSWLKNNVGKHYVYHNWVPTKSDMKAVLSRGPIAARIRWSNSGGHFLLVGGMNEQGDYWVHDPWQKNQEGKYQVLTYRQLKNYKSPESRSLGQWDWTMYIPS